MISFPKLLLHIQCGDFAESELSGQTIDNRYKASLSLYILTLYLGLLCLCRHSVMVEHQHYDSNNGNNIPHVDNMSPAAEPLVKG